MQAAANAPSPFADMSGTNLALFCHFLLLIHRCCPPLFLFACSYLSSFRRGVTTLQCAEQTFSSVWVHEYSLILRLINHNKIVTKRFDLLFNNNYPIDMLTLIDITILFILPRLL